MGLDRGLRDSSHQVGIQFFAFAVSHVMSSAPRSSAYLPLRFSRLRDSFRMTPNLYLYITNSTDAIICTGYLSRLFTLVSPVASSCERLRVPDTPTQMYRYLVRKLHRRLRLFSSFFPSSDSGRAEAVVISLRSETRPRPSPSSSARASPSSTPSQCVQYLCLL